jgi:hypothetical protein
MKTSEVITHLGTTHHKLWGLFRSNKIRPPGKDVSGDYVWSDEDVECARRALATDLRFGPRPKQKAVPA